jgi:hypothetical protein
MSELDGMQFLLCRDRDVLRTKTSPGPCCRNLAYYRNGKLWCVDCKQPRGRLPLNVITALIAMLKVLPEIKDQTHILRDTSELPNETENLESATAALAGNPDTHNVSGEEPADE